MYAELNNTILQKLKKEANIYETFNEVYIYGSILKKRQANDIDILIIYTNYSYKLKKDLKSFERVLVQLINLPIDITALSKSEEHDVKFIKRLNNHYIVLK